MRRKFTVIMIVCAALATILSGCGGEAKQMETADTSPTAQVENENMGSIAEESQANMAEQEIVSAPVTLPEAGEIVKSGAWGSGTYTLDSNGILTLSGTGNMYVLDGQEIPSSEEVLYAVVEEGVTGLGSHLERYTELQYVSLPSTITSFRFMDCQKLSTVILPEGITELENDAFENCKSLTEIELPSTLVRVGMRVFMNTGLTEIRLPDKMNYIDNAFCYTSITSLEWPEGVDTIYSGTFYSCPELSSVTLPKDVIDIRDGAFQDCPKLTDVYYAGTEDEFNMITIGNNNESLLNATIHYEAGE